MRVIRSSVRAASMLVLCVALPWTADAVAQDLPPEASERQAQGEALFEAENFDAALVEFERVYDLLDGYPFRYFVLYNIGQCHERLFRYDQALFYYQRYLDEGGPDAEDRGAVEGMIRALDGLLGTVTVEVSIEGAEVWIDDRMVGTAPGSFRVPSGSHVIEGRAEGYASSRAEATVAARREVTVSLALEALGADHGLHPAIFLTGAGLTLAALGVGIGFGVEALIQSDAASARADQTGERAYELVPEDLRRIDELGILADVFMFGVTGALAIGTFVLYLFTDWGGESTDATEPTAFVVPWLGPDPGLSIVGRM